MIIPNILEYLVAYWQTCSAIFDQMFRKQALKMFLFFWQDINFQFQGCVRVCALHVHLEGLIVRETSISCQMAR